MINETNSTTLAQRIDQGASQCVKCGLCLPHCPTYVVAENENESPRGRIALMQGAIREQVPISERLTYHLDTCLACRACEAVCPAGVQYEELITSTRAWLNPTHKLHYWERILIIILEKPRWRKLLTKLIHMYQRASIVQKIIAKFPKNHFFALIDYIPNTQNTNKRRFWIKILSHSGEKKKGRALLLSPCVSNIFDQQTIEDAKKVLSKLKWQVLQPPQENCCGALSLHAGQLAQAQQCARQQVKQWEAIQPDVILSLASGCHATLQEYSHAPLNISMPAMQVHTIEEFIFEQITQQQLKLAALQKRVVIQIPCTLRNAIRKPTLPLQLLQHIPELTCIPIPTSMGCCGAAGSNFLRHPDIAQKLVYPIVEFIREQQPDMWVSSNIGCALHIQHALKAQDINIPVLHPVSLIAFTSDSN